MVIKRPVAIGVILLVGLLVVALGIALTRSSSDGQTVGDAASPVPQKAINGTFVLGDKVTSIYQELAITKEGTSCYGSHGYSDITEGAPVVVKDEEDKIVATGSLGKGQSLFQETAFASCKFDFVVQVPERSFYSIQVSHRGAVTFSRTDLDNKNWSVELSLGDSGIP